MKGNSKITFARKICREYGIKYQIKNEALFLLCHCYDNKNKYIQVCYNVLNLDNGSIKGIMKPYQNKVVNGVIYL